MSSVGQVIPELASAIGDARHAQLFFDRLNSVYVHWNIGAGGIHSGGVCVLPRSRYREFLAGIYPEPVEVKKPRIPRPAAIDTKKEPVEKTPLPPGGVLTFEEWQLKRQMDETQKVTTKAKKKKAADKPAKKKKAAKKKKK
jgi:hypothetical protein